jgi:hypothetical protein
MSVLFIGVYRSDSSGSDTDGSGSDDNERVSKTMLLLRSNQNNLFATGLVAVKYYMTYLDKNEARTPAQSGFAWTMEILMTPGESEKMFRMTATLFHQRHDLLVSTYGLQSSLHMNSIESLAMFLVVCGHGMSNMLYMVYSSMLERQLVENLRMCWFVWCPYVRTISGRSILISQPLTLGSVMIEG